MKTFITRNENGTRPATDAKGLFAACEQIAWENGGIITRRECGSSRFVAFWCDYHNIVKPGYDATEDEREALADWKGCFRR